MKLMAKGTSPLLGSRVVSMLIIIFSACFFIIPHAQGGPRRHTTKGPKKNSRAVQSKIYVIGEPLNLTGECAGNIDFPEKQLTGTATIIFNGKEFEITSGATTLKGSLSVIARSSYLLSTSTNLTFEPRTTPILSLSLRGCYDMSSEGCDDPKKGQGRPHERISGFVLKRVENGEPRQFSFNSTSCKGINATPSQ